ncbi:hypothetical protein LFT48_05520 [Arthrobacter sp. FW305-123]|nr:hypothetical protein LFT48_05520 [Arthrobacter sp. FW305-123]
MPASTRPNQMIESQLDPVIPFFSSMFSHDWENLGYPSLRAAKFWNGRSCGVACLQMVYAALLPHRRFLPSTITEELLADGSYSEASGWNHKGLAEHARRNGLSASTETFGAQEQLVQSVQEDGIFIASIGHSFDSDGASGHLAVVIGISSSGNVHVHRPSSHHLTTGRDLVVDLQTFWEHFSGRGIRISKSS